jgi:hypothetical protein
LNRQDTIDFEQDHLFRGAIDRGAHLTLVLPGILAIIGGFASSWLVNPSGEMDEWFKSHAWKACIGS